ncbi:hypothetical protein QCE73_09375 [Caballeronia sp. LZ029]|uniref:hypothetical protein n=1 Tax=Caballeronia sp. LZ029 TaxID=3038564 RepID=UPI000459821C|nr:hypothetical protein [Caballeronia sp. LZ029]KAK43437.1 hypothetical protein BG58_32410 [Caballeronia jiangsuensis]MDR5743366.1 hypothetical protein [Caballeronia sp. LZ029]
MFDVVFKASIAKNIEEQDANEDATSIDSSRGIFAISDGASESFDSQSWARLLVSRFIEEPSISVCWVDAARRLYERTSDFGAMSWSRQAAFERGSFATLLGAEWRENLQELEIIAVGDSLAVHLSDADTLESFPYRRAEEFDARPKLLSTLSAANVFVASRAFNTESCVVWPLTKQSIVLMMTDALGHWLLNTAESARSRADLLLAANTEDAFRHLVLEQRRIGAMRVDDTTLLVLGFDGAVAG